MSLNGKQKRYLRSLGNQVKATVYIGQNGVTEPVLQSIEEAFNTNELIKVKLQEGFLGERKEIGAVLAEQSESELVQTLGKTVLLYRENEDEPVISLPL